MYVTEEKTEEIRLNDHREAFLRAVGIDPEADAFFDAKIDRSAANVSDSVTIHLPQKDGWDKTIVLSGSYSDKMGFPALLTEVCGDEGVKARYVKYVNKEDSKLTDPVYKVTWRKKPTFLQRIKNFFHR